jgi:hypothetical protein
MSSAIWLAYAVKMVSKVIRNDLPSLRADWTTQQDFTLSANQSDQAFTHIISCI